MQNKAEISLVEKAWEQFVESWPQIKEAICTPNPELLKLALKERERP